MGGPIWDARVVGQAGVLRRVQVIGRDVLVRIGRGANRVRGLAVGAVVGEERVGWRVERAWLNGRDGVVRRRVVKLRRRLQRRQLVQTRMRQRRQLGMVVLLVVMMLAEGVSSLVLTQAWIDGGRHEEHETQEPQ